MADVAKIFLGKLLIKGLEEGWKAEGESVQNTVLLQEAADLVRRR